MKSDEVAANLIALRKTIAELEQRHDRTPGSVKLLAVSKTKPWQAVRAAYEAGQLDFGENHLQDALTKLDAPELRDTEIVWHFIGPVQSNKSRTVAERFAWVHSLDRERLAQRLNDQRPPHLPPLNVCIQVNLSGEASKSGVSADELSSLAQSVARLPRLRLRGLMTLPRPSDDAQAQRLPFRTLRELLLALNRDGFELDTLSMGMSNDMESAIAEGSTMVRIGTAIFGARS
ncbi:MAG: YggS family pyridoxal phosphate-dependent enzyme [Gammaproteobacteria bacterium]|nr:YggS family pyridoxal phosphate-dependent enzyme [Gammaproteobacteria bacterium]